MEIGQAVMEVGISSVRPSNLRQGYRQLRATQVMLMHSSVTATAVFMWCSMLLAHVYVANL